MTDRTTTTEMAAVLDQGGGPLMGCGLLDDDGSLVASGFLFVDGSLLRDGAFAWDPQGGSR